jgi:hypothetical protein
LTIGWQDTKDTKNTKTRSSHDQDADTWSRYGFRSMTFVSSLFGFVILTIHAGHTKNTKNTKNREPRTANREPRTANREP